MDVINFYGAKNAFGEFSNFSAHPIFLKGKSWPTTEHYFQAQKFAGTPHEEAIRLLPTPGKAAQMGRSRKLPLRPDWESVKEDVMREAVYAKFTQHEELKTILLDTGEAKLVEHTANDAYWGDGGDGKGKNRLGHLLMEIRERIRNESELGR